ncbi:MAG: peptidase M13 [Candidatus Ryanbacteria bacterium CG10_big_fil_rev_8_21_14_0_10_43_42]|uniref:Peptidase M13 n=1 Tax=Candidatus Ryanbacteria bacterium CG10_big_fil_rev_8_21_14_0_10_43_42 TaxID=1974864 RepID=A0A2M8KX95_9BACT|nr:MAG: peptidase M13 [Candidatus Ryanbacteria bacterium CG10_big_fil_rev_8_21_14_0_10_43_42]
MNHIDKEDFDESVSPGDDFFQYVNGGWLESTEIPPAESTWGTFYILRDQSNAQLREIAEDLLEDNNREKGSNEQKIRDFYKTGMDMSTRNEHGIKAIQEELYRTNVDTKEDVIQTLARFHTLGIGALWMPYIESDDKNVDVMIFRLHQAGIGLPDREYYLAKDSEREQIRQKYVSHIVRIFLLIGKNEEEARKGADSVYAIEHALAEVSMTRTKLRDIAAQHNKMTRENLAISYPAIPWAAYFSAVNLPDTEQEIIVDQPEFFTAIEKLLQTLSFEDWRLYLTWCLVHAAAPFLSEEFINENFAFYGRVLGGAKELRPLWKRVITVLDGVLGECIGQEYVKRYFSKTAKERINELVDNLILAYEDRIKNLSWMGEETKQKAIEKLHAIERKLGYPDTWRDYSALSIGSDSYIKNYFRAMVFEWNRMIAKLGRPVDRTEWHISPATVNAYYNPLYNEILFPAAILQPPFFHERADDALNYGAIGSVIGHELTHGFDDQGSQFDAKGNRKNWWNEEDKRKFEEKAGMLVEQYNAYEVLPGKYINGELTLGENIADLGGLTIAYDAFQKSQKGREFLQIDDMTPDARFFASFAIGERGKMRDELAAQMLIVDPHSPAKARVNNIVSNMDEFYNVFRVTEQDKLYRLPEKRAKIW